MPTRGKDHRPAQAALPTIRGSRAAADPPTPLGTTARARRHQGLPLAAAATGEYGLADRLSLHRQPGGTISRPQEDPGHTGARVCHHFVRIVISPICPYCASS
jgi:hypothetical protein